MDSRPKGVVPATSDHVAEVAAGISPDHAREVFDTSGLAAADALSLSLAASMEAYAWLDGESGRALFLMGVGTPSVLTQTASLWMLGTAKASSRPVALLRAGRWGVERAFAVTGAERLEQFIPGWYLPGIRFVLRLGFGVSPCPLCCRDGSPLWHVVLHRGSLMVGRGTKRRPSVMKEGKWEAYRTCSM